MDIAIALLVILVAAGTVFTARLVTENAKLRLDNDELTETVSQLRTRLNIRRTTNEGDDW